LVCNLGSASLEKKKSRIIRLFFFSCPPIPANAQSYQARAVRLAAPNPRLIPLAALGCPRLYQFQKKLQSQPSMKATIFPMKAGL